MGILAEIQAGVFDEEAAIAPLLLRLRLLAAMLDSDPLEKWVKFESEGYPPHAILPEYRQINVSYSASFAGPFGSGVNNAQIPTYLIKKYAGKQWLKSPTRSSISEIDHIMKQSTESGSLSSTNASNLILLLNGKVFPDYSCIDVQGHISTAEVAAIRHAVRSRILELTIQIKKQIPAANDLTIEAEKELSKKEIEKVTEITNNVVYGNQNNVESSGANANIVFNINQGDAASLQEALTKAGMKDTDARELAEIIASEKPESNKPLGTKAFKWLSDNIQKLVGSVGTSMITAAAMQYYGLSQ